MSEINADKLIKAVKVRPAIYNRNDTTYYSNKKYKAKMWREVCTEVYPGDWEQLRPQDRVDYSHEVQKRWKSLRTCFTRELSVQKKDLLRKEKNQEVKKRKRYEHFDAMRFLLDPDAETTVRSESDESSDPLDESNIKNETIYDDPPNRMDNAKIILEADPDQYQSFFERSRNVEGKVLDVLREIKKDEEDEDRQFMLSLVPTFRKLQDKQKFEARIEILKVLQNISCLE